MSIVKVTLPVGELPVNGKQVSFIAPCDCTQTEALQIEGVNYTIVDALCNCVTGKGGRWDVGAVVSVILDVDKKLAYIQNANLAAEQVALAEATAAALGLPNGASVDNALALLSGSIAVESASITLNDLELGSVLTFNETVSGKTNAVEFELVSKDYNGTGRALVVRKNAWDTTGNFGGYNSLYGGSIIDEFMTTYLQYLDADVQTQISNVDIPVIVNLSSGAVGTISRRVFALSNAELGLTARNTEGAAIPYFTSATRKKTNSGGTAAEYWTRTVSTMDSGRAYRVATGGGYTDGITQTPASYVPAFTLPLDFATNYVYDLRTAAGESVTEKVAQALGLPGAQIETGTYKGTGTYGSSNPNSLTFGFEPKMVIISTSSNGEINSNHGATFGIWAKTGSNPSLMLVFDASNYQGNKTGSASSWSWNAATLNGNTLSWYYTDSQRQLNNNGQYYMPYHYIAIG